VGDIFDVGKDAIVGEIAFASAIVSNFDAD